MNGLQKKANQPFLSIIILAFSLAASAVMPFMLAQVPLATYFHSLTSAWMTARKRQQQR